MTPVTCKITHAGAEHSVGTRWYAELGNLPDGGCLPRFLLGKAVAFTDGDGRHVGIGQSGLTRELPELTFHPDRHGDQFGAWPRFIWPTVLAEGGGRHLTVNSYDRARFTFGFYQLAAHTPGDNLILLFRRLLALPAAAAFLPDLTLRNGRVHQHLSATALRDLETVVTVKRPNGKSENQLLWFMKYLNNDDQTIERSEVEMAARLMGWLLTDPAAVCASVEVAIAIMRRKLRAAAARHGLTGGPVEQAIWVSDILHQGRGTHHAIASALAHKDYQDRLKALSLIGSGNKAWDARRATVSQAIARLSAEGRFRDMRLGEAALSL